MTENGAIEIASVGDRPPRTMFAHMLTDIIEPRAVELLSLIHDDLERAGLDRQIAAGFVLAGGGAPLPGLDEIAGQSFPLPGRVSVLKSFGELPGLLAEAENSTVAGLGFVGAKSGRARPQRTR